MSYRGRVKNGVVEFEDGVRPPEGAVVRVEPVESATEFDISAADEYIRRMLALAGTAGPGLPSDLARNLDHYLYGTPKR